MGIFFFCAKLPAELRLWLLLKTSWSILTTVLAFPWFSYKSVIIPVSHFSMWPEFPVVDITYMTGVLKSCFLLKSFMNQQRTMGYQSCCASKALERSHADVCTFIQRRNLKV